SDNYMYGIHFQRNFDVDAHSNLIANNTVNGNDVYGILIESFNNSRNNTVTGNTLTHNTDGAIYIVGPTACDITGDTVTDNFLDSNGNGLMVGQTDGTTFANNTVLNSSNTGFFSYKAASRIYENTLCGSGWTDMYSYNWSDHASDGDDNTCDHFGGWNDNGTAGCTNLCPNVSLAVVLLFPENGSFFPSNDSLNLTFIANDILNGTTLNCTLNITNTYDNATLNVDAQSRVPKSTSVAGLGAGNYVWQGVCINFENQTGISIPSAFILNAVCGNLICESNETCDNCPVDCGICPYCGDGNCSAGETCTRCPEDCGRCSGGSSPYCGDGRCNGDENCSTCAGDCGACPGPVCTPANCNGTCVNDTCVLPYCGDNACGAGENCSICPSDCGQCLSLPMCGDGTCGSDENCSTCTADCGNCTIPVCSPATCPDGACINNTCVAPYCGDGSCNANESCSACASDCGKCADCNSDSECSASERCSSGACIQKTGCAYSNPGCGPCFLCTSNACAQSPSTFSIEAQPEVPVNSTVEAAILDQSGFPVAGLQVKVIDPLNSTSGYTTNSTGKFTFVPSIAGQYSYQLPCELAKFTNALATSGYDPSAPAGTRTLIIPVYVTEPSSLQLSVLSLGKPMQASLSIAKPDTSATDTATDAGGRYQGVLTVPGKYVFTITAYNAKSLAADIELSPLPAARGILEEPAFWVLLILLFVLLASAYLLRNRLIPSLARK
ncbi:MAG: NosD domain-containing protein, partial [Candidatus Micrarchaeia archaeon]